MRRYSKGVVLAALWLAACGSVEKENIDEKLAEALCAREVRCGLYTDQDACERAMMQGLIVSLGVGRKYDDSLARGRMRFDKEAAERCLESLRDGSCEVNPLFSQDVFLGFGQNDECRFLTGTVADGEPCQWTAECGPRSFCTAQLALDTCSGICQRRAEEGESASSGGDFWCAPGLTADQGVCKVPGGEGESCRRSSTSLLLTGTCASGLYCTEDPPHCQRFQALGEPCAAEEGLFCAWNLLCVEGSCRWRGREGEECSLPPAQGLLVNLPCMLDLFCDASGDAPGKCRDPRGEGASCRGGLECKTGLYCAGWEPGPEPRQGTCQRRTPLGGACPDPFQCAPPAVCRDGTCVEPATCEPLEP